MNNDGRKRIDGIMKDIEGATKEREEIDAMISRLNSTLTKLSRRWMKPNTQVNTPPDTAADHPR